MRTWLTWWDPPSWIVSGGTPERAVEAREFLKMLEVVDLR